MNYLKRITELLEEIKTLLGRDNTSVAQNETPVYPTEIRSEDSRYLVNIGYLEDFLPYDRMNPLYNKTLWSIFSKLYAGGIKVKSFTLYKLKKEERSKLSGTLKFMIRNYDKIYPAYRLLLSGVKNYRGGQVVISFEDTPQESVELLLRLLDQFKNGIIHNYTWNKDQKTLTITNIFDINFLRGGWFEQAMQLNLPNFFLEANPYGNYVFLSNLKYETKYGNEGEIDGMVLVSDSGFYNRLFILEYKTSSSLSESNLTSFNNKSAFIKTCLYQFFTLRFYMIVPQKLTNGVETSNYIFTLCSVDEFVSKLKQDMGANNG
ncbi:MAG: hypothetical protein ACPLRS_00475 [Hydrogenobacter sp.]